MASLLPQMTACGATKQNHRCEVSWDRGFESWESVSFIFYSWWYLSFKLLMFWQIFWPVAKCWRLKIGSSGRVCIIETGEHSHQKLVNKHWSEYWCTHLKAGRQDLWESHKTQCVWDREMKLMAWSWGSGRRLYWCGCWLLRGGRI